MIDHVSIYVSDLKKSKEFYERAFAGSLNYTILFEVPGFLAFDTGNKSCLFELIQASPELIPIQTKTHVAFRAKTNAEIDQFYKNAMEAGGSDNGAPGPRPQYTPEYYACFVRDLDGHNIEVMMR